MTSTLVREDTLDDVPPGRHVLVALDRTGDTRHIWDPNNQAEVDGAKALFDSLRQSGHVAYRVNEEGGKGQVMRDFDPEAQKMILAPPLRGG